MVVPCIEYVKRYAKQHNKTYACAIPDAATSYKTEIILINTLRMINKYHLHS